ncbi:hypothetical protein [Arthrobacter halodurans]|uniref:Uncharacterized protein n=1 Tax=Arthrobacter halodurans TaxID=516699 RepID=A0ABV4UMU2_9MICC
MITACIGVASIAAWDFARRRAFFWTAFWSFAAAAKLLLTLRD